jgi:hypothetical protein
LKCIVIFRAIDSPNHRFDCVGTPNGIVGKVELFNDMRMPTQLAQVLGMTRYMLDMQTIS